MDIKNFVLTDGALELIDNGHFVGDLPNADGVRLKVLGLQSEVVRKALDQKQTAKRLQKGGAALTADEIADCMRAVLGEVVLQDWDGITSGGKPVKFSRDLAKEWTGGRKGAKFADLVLMAAQRLDEGANDFAEAATKN